MAIGIACAIVFLGFGFQQCSRSAGMNGSNEEGENESPTVAKIGSIPVTMREVSDAATAMNSQSGGAQTYAAMAQDEEAAVTRVVSRAALQYIAQRDHIPMTDDVLMKVAQPQVDQEVQQAMSQVLSQAKLRNPTQKAIEDAFKAQYKVTPDQMKQRGLDNLHEMLADKDQRQRLVEQLAPEVVQDALAAKMQVSDEQLKQNYQTLMVKRIFLQSGPKNPDPVAAANKVEDALKGGLAFEAAMNKYSNDPPPSKGKQVSDNQITVPNSMTSTVPDYKPLQGQKVGYVSPPVSVYNGEAIYKVVSVRDDSPKDLKTNAAKYKQDYAKGQAPAELQKEVQTILNGPETVWSDPGDKALYELSQQYSLSGPAAVHDLMVKVVDQAKAIANGNAPVDATAAVYAWYLAEDYLYNQPNADKAKLEDGRIEVLNAVLRESEDFDIRMELVGLDIKKKDGQDAIANLTAAAEANTTYDTTGQRRFGDIMAKRGQLLIAGLAKESQLKDLDQAQAQWRKDKASSDAQDAEMKKEEAQQKAADAANEAKNRAELAKQKAAEAGSAPKTGPAPRPGGPSQSLIPPGTIDQKPSSPSLIPPGTIDDKGKK